MIRLVKNILIENISPVIFYIGPFAVRWYGLMMALSFALGTYLLLLKGREKGYAEESLLSMVLFVLIFGMLGARALYVLTNLGDFAASPPEIIRIDRGGLSFHGGLLGGVLSGWVLARRRNFNFDTILDLAVPGVAIGYALVRVANIFNQEILGRPAVLLALERHPTQLYGTLIGLLALLIHNLLARRVKKTPGVLFWSFIFYYSLLRGIIEETFRENPLYLLGYVNEFWGAGFFTLTHLVTPPLLIFAWWMIQSKKGHYLEE